MNEFPSLQSSTSAAKQPENHGPPIGAEGTETLTSAEQLMRKHHQHLSYEEIRSATSNGDQDQHTGLSNGNGVPSSQPPNKKNRDKKQQPDLDSETAFPSLGTPAAAPKTAGGWGASPALSSRSIAGRSQKPDLSNSNQFTETLVLLLSSIHIGPVPPQYREKGPRAAGEKREEDPKTLPDVLRAIHKRHPTVILESSTSRDRVTIIFRTPFNLPPPVSSTPALIRAASSLAPEERIVRARQELITRVTRKIEKIINIPVTVKPFVIGQRGRVMKEIIEITGANISLPPKDESRQGNVDPPAEQPPANGSDQVETITITISGEESAVLDAEDRIMMIVREHTNKVNRKITSLPVESYPLLNNRNPKISEVVLRGLVNDLGINEEEINCHLNIPSINQIFKSHPSHLCLADPEANNTSHSSKGSSPSKESLPITVSGDRQQVEYAIKVLESTFQNMTKSITKVELELPKRQHKFLDNRAIEEILESTGSLVILPPASDLSEKVVIRGENMSNVQALGLVVTKANALTVESLDLKKIYPQLPDTSSYSKSVIAYLSIKAHQTKLKQIQDECTPKGVKIYLPLQSSAFSTIDIASKEPESIKHAKGLVETYIRNSMKPEYFVNVEVDRLLHRHILKKKNPRLKALLDHNGIEMIIPPEQDPSSTILLVASKAIIGKDVKANGEHDLTTGLSKAKEEILKSVKELAEMKTVTLQVPQKLHDHIVGPNQTTLNVIIGEDKLVTVQVGSPDSADQITIRGSKNEVDRVDKEIRRMAEEATVTEATNSYSTEFEIDSKLVSHLVGKGGAAISKLGEELGVRVDFVDQVANGTSHEDGGGANHHKKRKNAHAKVSVTISGRMENVEEAKKRILNHAERLADEVTVTLPIAAGLDRGALIGKGGMYITRLQDTHMVHINMPRSRKEDNTANGHDADITIRGPRKGVEAVKRELIELMEYEREQGNTASMDISTKSVSRIVGKRGAQAEKIKEDSGLQSLDIDKLDSSEGVSRVTMKGSKAAIVAAKKMINGIVQTVDDECFAKVKIPRAYHQALIGRGGARLRELVKMAGVDESASKLVHFPRTSSEKEEEADVVQIKGDKNVVSKIQRQLELEAERLINQFTYGLFVPKSCQLGIIGRAASGIKAIQEKHHVTIIAPGWSQWATSDQPVNHADLQDIDSDEIFKVLGNKDACLSAMEDLKSKIVVKDRPERSAACTKAVMVPAQFHHLISQNGRFFRSLPRGVRVNHPGVSIPSLDQSTDTPAGTPPANVSRIDVDDGDHQDQPVILSWKTAEVKLNGISEVPWNVTGPEAEVEKIEQAVRSQLEFWRSKSEAEGGKIYVTMVKVPAHVMPGIIGKGGIGLRDLTAKSDAAFIEVLGKAGSDTLRIVGTAPQMDIIKSSLNQMRRRAQF